MRFLIIDFAQNIWGCDYCIIDWFCGNYTSLYYSMSRFFYNTFLYLLTNLFIDVAFLYWQVFFRRVKETNKTTNLQARFFYNAVLYCLTDLPIDIVYLYWQVLSFLEYFPQTNVFAWICTVYALLIIGCSIRYPKTGILRYSVTELLTVRQGSVGNIVWSK